MSQEATVTEYRMIQLFWFFVLVSVFSMSFYLYAVNTTIRHIVSRKNSDAEINTLTVALGDLESRYVALGAIVTPERALEIGLAPATEISFINQNTPAKALSLRGNEI